MNTFFVKSIPLKDVIRDLANEMQTNFSENCNLYTLEIPNRLGFGYIEGIDFENGFGMLNYHCNFREPTTFSFTFDQVHPLKFMHCYGGSFIHRFEEERSSHQVRHYENIIVGSQHNNGHILEFEADQPIRISSVELDRPNFIDKIICHVNLETEEKEIMNAIQDIDATTHFYHKGKYSIHISDIILNILGTRKSPLLKTLLYEGESYKMLVNHIQQYYSDVYSKGEYVPRQAEVEQVRAIAEFISENLSNSITVESLEKKFGINGKKLQMLFRMLYNNSVNQFIQKRRLEKALQLMKESDFNMSEIANAIGLSSKSYFSKIFKEKYGISPSHYHKNIQKQNIFH